MDSITLFELLITGGIPIGAAVAVWIKMRVDVGSLTTKLDYLEKSVAEEKEANKVNYKDIRETLDSIFKVITEIKVSIAKK